MPSLARGSDISQQVGKHRRLRPERGGPLGVAACDEVVGRTQSFVDLRLHKVPDLLIRQLPAGHLGGADACDGFRDLTALQSGDSDGVRRLGVVDRAERERSADTRTASCCLRAVIRDLRRRARQIWAG